MKTEYLKPISRVFRVYTEEALVLSATGSASGQNITYDAEGDFDSFFGS